MQWSPSAGNSLLNSLISLGNSLEFESSHHDSHDVLIEADESSDYLYFPHRGSVVSLTRSVQTGATVEVAIVGFEGVVNVQIILAGTAIGIESIVQVRGTLSRVRTADVRELMERDVRVRELLMLYAATFLAQVTQHTLCNRLHSVEQRLAKWLLGVHDRIESNTIRLTHDFLAQMMGTRRPGVTVAIGDLALDGLITSVRNAVTIVDRDGLKQRSCECYASILLDTKSYMDKITTPEEKLPAGS